jgi:hypothetical protein
MANVLPFALNALACDIRKGNSNTNWCTNLPAVTSVNYYRVCVIYDTPACNTAAKRDYWSA